MQLPPGIKIPQEEQPQEVALTFVGQLVFFAVRPPAKRMPRTSKPKQP